MRPTLPVECEIEIVPLPAQTPLGALIVFVIDDTLIAHRLVRRSGGRWIAQGDGRLGPDRPLQPSQILGVVAAARRDGRQCWPTVTSRWLTAFWVARYWALRPAGSCAGHCDEPNRPIPPSAVVVRIILRSRGFSRWPSILS